jgi:twinkle protein
MTSRLKATPFDIENFLINHGLEIRRRGKKAEIKICPFCHGGAHNDLWKCVVYLDESGGNYKCMRGSCNATGTFWGLVEHFGEDPKKFYELENNWNPLPAARPPMEKFTPITGNFDFASAPDLPEKPLAQQAIEYLRLRGLSADLVETAPIWCDEQGRICFGYYHKGELCMVKVRHPRKIQQGEQKAWQQWKGGLRPLWCIERCDPAQGPLVVVFGEYDALALQQAGVPNVTSVPCGDNDLEWINVCWQELHEYKEIVLWPDNDKSGHEAMLRIAERLGEERLRVVRSPYKDPNEHLAYRMQEVAEEADLEIRQLVANAPWLRPGDLDNLAHVVDQARCFDGYTSGIAELDKLIGGYFFGQLIVHYGDTKHGKSAGVNQITAMAVEQGGRVCVWAGEDDADSYKYKLYTHLAGREGIEVRQSERTGTQYAFVPDSTRTKIDRWIDGKVILFNPRTTVTEDLLLQNFELAYRRYGCNVFVVDNLMKLVYAKESESVFSRQARITENLSNFAKTHRVTVHLVVHTSKKQGTNPNDPPDRNNISGAKEIINLCDRAQFWWRVPPTARGKYGENESVTGIAADRVWGNEGEVELRYWSLVKRFGTTREEIHRRYGWMTEDAHDAQS